MLHSSVLDSLSGHRSDNKVMYMGQIHTKGAPDGFFEAEWEEAPRAEALRPSGSGSA